MVAAAASLAAAEMGLALLLRRASAFDHVLAAARRYYHTYEVRIAQYLPATARYDPRLTYRLRPGHSVFANREFETVLAVNSLGVRDDEESLVRPAIVVLGDSFAMGWGVGEGRSFPDLIEQRSGRKVLNASVSSYGTAREVLLLDEVDRSALTALVIQYADNDYVENRTFVDAGFHLPVMARAAYEEICQEHARLRYYPGKYLHRFLPLLLTVDDPAAARATPPPASPAAAAEAFLDVLSYAAPRLAGARIIVFEVNGFALNDSAFIDAVRRRAHERPDLSRIETVDLSTRLSAAHFLPIDGHLNEAGHAVVAEAVLETLYGGGTAAPE
jgi:hypothetical protein